MDSLSAAIAELGSQADQGLTLFVNSQVQAPSNFRDLVEVLMESEPDRDRLNYFLAAGLATAVIRLASIERIES